MNTKKISAVRAELIVEATASLKQEIEKELGQPDPEQGSADFNNFAEAYKKYKEQNGQGKDTP